MQPVSRKQNTRTGIIQGERKKDMEIKMAKKGRVEPAQPRQHTLGVYEGLVGSPLTQHSIAQWLLMGKSCMHDTSYPDLVRGQFWLLGPIWLFILCM